MDEATKALAQIAKRQLDDARAEIARLTAERDQAEARAAAAAMEMRERAAATYAMYSGVDLTKRLISLPIDPDAQQALNKMLTEAEQRGYANAMEAERKDADQLISKAREDAIREAARAMNPMLRSMVSRGQAAKAILALLNDGGRDE